RFTFLFFLLSEVGIRHFHVTGVQTCALPILRRLSLYIRSTSNSGKKTSPPCCCRRSAASCSCLGLVSTTYHCGVFISVSFRGAGWPEYWRRQWRGRRPG